MKTTTEHNMLNEYISLIKKINKLKLDNLFVDSKYNHSYNCFYIIVFNRIDLNNKTYNFYDFYENRKDLAKTMLDEIKKDDFSEIKGF